MSRRIVRAVRVSTALVAALVSTNAGVRGQSGAKNVEWSTYGGDLGHTRYAPLDQITAENFSKLMLNGKQHLAIAISGGAYSGELLASRLPNQRCGGVT